MKVCCVSDIHGYLPEIPECDLLLIAGDICPLWNHALNYQEYWLKEVFKPWINNVPAKKTIFILGNHDLIGQEKPYIARRIFDEYNATYLQDSHCEYEGLKIWGSPYSSTYGDWAFMEDENKLSQIWESIPKDTDIIVVHGPPHGYGDVNLFEDHCGSISLTNKIKEIKPKLVVAGHIHEDYGQFECEGTKILNASLMFKSHQTHFVGNEPFLIDL